MTTTRRAFLLRTTVLGGLGLLAAACSPSVPAPAATPAAPKPATGSGATGTAPAAPAASAAQPKRGGTLTWAQWDRNDALDPASPSGASATEIIGNVLDTLVVMDENQKIYPSLATKWTMDGGGTSYTFTLRDDVKFTDGSALDATVVKRNWERILDPKTKAAGVVSLFGPINAIKAPDPRTLTVSFKEPFPQFLQAVWRPYFGILSPKVLDAAKVGEPISDIVGSGPYRLAGRAADGLVTLEANAAYAWGSEAFKNRKAPYIQTIKLRSVQEPGTRLATLESGENLLIDELSEPDYARLKADRRFTFVETPRKGIALGFSINVSKAPTDDAAVRQAMSWAIDRKSIVDKLFFGVHKVTVGPLAEGVWGRWEGAEKVYGYDPKKAQDLLEVASWKVGPGGIREKAGQKLAVDLVTFRSPWTEIAEAAQAQFRQVGIDLQIQKMERGAYLDYVRAYKHNMSASAGTNIDADELRNRYASKGIPAANFSNLKDTELDAMLARGAQLPADSAERMKVYEDAQRRLMDIAPFVSVMSQVRVMAMASKVKDLRMVADGLNAQPMLDTWIDA
ncbi:MAG: hypothetical protein HYX52_02835 [Chloroflexi bacterium]|nr:hypothetical protein [Chloroflexota bacterium]